MKLNFSNHINEIWVFSFLLLMLLLLSRIFSLVIFGNWQDIGQSFVFLDDLFVRGFRFDIKLLSTILLVFFWFPILCFSWLLSEKWFALYLNVISNVILIFIIYLIFVDLGYLYYFHKPIDVLIFGLLEDDTNAIISTMLNNSKILLFFAGFGLLTYLLLRLFSKLKHRFKNHSETVIKHKSQFIFWFVSFLVLLVLARGSLDTFPLQRKHASVSDNAFMNAMVMNSAFNLYYANRDRMVNNEVIFKTEILKSNHLESEEALKQKSGYNNLNPLIRTTDFNAELERVKPHVIFVMMEGWSSQIALAQSSSNDVLGEFAQHAKQDYFYTRFFANQYATNPSAEALLLNSPITPLSQSIANKTRFKQSNVLPFKNKGYQTLFLSGGYSSWRNHNNFWLLEGFDSYIGRSRIEQLFQVDASNNPWGVYDEFVFEYLKKSILDAESQNRSLFSFVLTTNNHPPVRLPDSYVEPPLDPSAYGFEKNNAEKRTLLTGYNYQTDQLGKFMSWLKTSSLSEKVIVVATGDHPLRTFSDNNAITEKYLRFSVPAYFYIPESFDRLKTVSRQIPGSHNDLFPTLFELSLSNASYYNFGQPLMKKDPEKAYGWASSGEFIFSDGVASSLNKKIYTWNDEHKTLLISDSQSISDHQSAMIEQEFYRTILKKYLIVKDYKNQNE